MVGKKNRFRCDKIYDIVRCAVLCESMAQSVATLRAIHATPPDAENPPFAIDAITDTWSSPTESGWADVTVNGHMRDDTNQHKCEIAIIHKVCATAALYTPLRLFLNLVVDNNKDL